MKDEPSERLDPRAKVVWRISAALNMIPLLAAGLFGSFAIVRWADVTTLLGILPGLAVLVLAAGMSPVVTA